MAALGGTLRMLTATGDSQRSQLELVDAHWSMSARWTNSWKVTLRKGNQLKKWVMFQVNRICYKLCQEFHPDAVIVLVA